MRKSLVNKKIPKPQPTKNDLLLFESDSIGGISPTVLVCEERPPRVSSGLPYHQ